MVMSRDQNAGRIQSVRIDNSTFESVEEFKYLGTLTNQSFEYFIYIYIYIYIYTHIHVSTILVPCLKHRALWFTVEMSHNNGFMGHCPRRNTY